MSTPVRIAGFVAGLAALFGVALAVGSLVGPTTEPVAAHDEDGHDSASDDEGHQDSHAAEPGADGGAVAASAEIPGGLMVSQSGYTLRLADDHAAPGRDVPVSFEITDPEGRPLASYDVEHEKKLHLIAVRRDFTGFQHVHPTLDSDGSWQAELDLTPGSWRLFADFKATGADALTLGADLSVAGTYAPADAAGETRTAHVDGYTVTINGQLKPGTDAKLTLEVTKDGRPVTDLQPYLGAYGHLVALREGDLAYLHVHPDGSPGDGETRPGPDVVFYAAVPSAGTYRLYLDFQHDGVVRTAEFRVSTVGAAGPVGEAEHSDGDDHGGH